MQDRLRPRFFCGCEQFQQVTGKLSTCSTSSLKLPDWAAAQEAAAVEVLQVRSQILETCTIYSSIFGILSK